MLVIIKKKNGLREKVNFFLIQKLGWLLWTRRSDVVRQSNWLQFMHQIQLVKVSIFVTGKSFQVSHSFYQETFNTICDACMDYVGSNTDKCNPCLRDLLCCFQLANPYRLDFPNTPLWTWSNIDRSSKSCIDRILIRKINRNIRS